MEYKFGDNIKDLICFKPKIFSDFRGENWEGYNHKDYLDILIQIPEFKFSPKFIIDSFSHSYGYVLRGFHGDTLNFKLVQCLRGKIKLAVIDLRPSFPTFNKVEEFELDDVKRWQILIPPGCVNAHQCLSNDCIFHYKLSHSYVPIEKQLHIKYNDPKYNIHWPLHPPILSTRDAI